MSDKLILAFDCGTQSARALLYDDKGALVVMAKNKYQEPYVSPQEGFCEQDADFYFDAICKASLALKEKAGEAWQNIIGVTITCMRDVGVCLDENKKPLRNAVLWLDRRRAQPIKVPKRAKLMLALGGMTEIINKKILDCKHHWIRQNQPEIWAKTATFAQLSAYLNYKICGNLTDSIASTVGHIPFDYKKGEWLPQTSYKAPLFYIEPEKLYPLVKPGEIIGKTTKELNELAGIPEGLPVVVSGSDKSAETVGTGAINEGIASISCGTTATIQLTTKKYVEPIKFLPAYNAIYPNRYNPEYIIYRGFWMLTWFINEFKKGESFTLASLEEELSSGLPTIPPGCNGLFCEPYWNPGMNLPEARGALVGFNDVHTAMHVYRAIIEGINYQLIKGLKMLEKNSKTRVTQIMASGGGASSDEVLQIAADMFGVPVTRAQTHETSGLGAAICAFVGLKHFNSFEDAVAKMVHHGKTFAPNAQNHGFYKNFYEKIYSKTYQKLKPLYKRIKQLK
jgi:sugar (pentulose or hexulose) kinase